MDKKLFLLLYFFKMCMSAVDYSHALNNIPIDITCNITRGNFNKAKNVTLCRVASSLNILNPNMEVILITPDNVKVDGFHAEKKTINWLPKFVDNQASNLRALSVVNSQMTNLAQNCLKLLINLESLDLSINVIKKLESNLFEFNKMLTFINLRENQINFIGLGTFDELKHLDHLYLHDNECVKKIRNAVTREEVKRLTKMLKTNNCQISKDISSSSIKSSEDDEIKATTKNYMNPSTTPQYTYEMETSTITYDLSWLDSISLNNRIIILLIILLVLIVICSSLVCHIISTSKRNRSQSSNRQPQRNVRISLVNNYTALPYNKPENLNDNDINSIEMDQRVTLGIYEEILEYQRIPDDTYQSPFDDSSNYIIETTKNNLNIELSQDDLYAKVNDELYQEILCHDSEALGDKGTAGLLDDTYNDPKDVFHQNLEYSYDYAELNDKNQQNISQNSIKLYESQTIDQSLESEDLYAETTMEKQQEYDLYATIQKV